MTRVENRVILIILFLQLGHPLGATLDTVLESKDHTNRRIMERLSFGKMWYVYIKANIFDIVVHTFPMTTVDSNATSMSLHGALTQISRLKISRHPCQNLNISFNGSLFPDDMHKKELSQMEIGLTKSKICGSISRNFRTVVPSVITREGNYNDLTWLWQIQVNQHFIINVTFLLLESRFYPPCITRRALIQETRDLDLSQKHTLGVFCPNNPPQSFYSGGNNIEINVHTWNIYEDFFWKNDYFNQWIGMVSFTYEILDNDLSLDPWKLLERRSQDPYGRLDGRWPSGKDEYYHHSELTSLHPHKLPAVQLTKSSNNERTAYLFQFFESDGEMAFTFYFQSYLGATIAIREGSLTCTKTQATLVAYEGPMVDMTRVESLLVRLQEWNCGHYMKATNYDEELKGRIGDMTILLLVEKESISYFYSLILKAAFRAVETNPSFALRQKLYLENSSRINFEQKGTYYYSISIQSAKTGFVSIYFDHISLRGYVDQTCTYGGIYFVYGAIAYNARKMFVGAMCSQKTATRFQRLYGRHGLTFNDHVLIHIKQYHLLFLANVKLRFSLHQCLGLYNPVLYSSLTEYVYDKRRHVEITRAVFPFYFYGANFYYRWHSHFREDHFRPPLGIKRMSGTACYKVNYVNFDTIDVVDAVNGGVIAVVSTGRVENVRPSRMSMAFWNMDEELKHFEKCLANALRFFPDSQNNEPYVLIKAPEEALWVTLAFAAKFALDMTCLIFGGAYQLHMQEGYGYSQCFPEIGGYLYDTLHPIIPKGVRGGILVNFYHKGTLRNNRVSFQRPLMHKRCCHLNMLVMSKSFPCIKDATAIRKSYLRAEELRGTYLWSNQINASEIFTWRALCTNNNPYLGLYIPSDDGYISSFIETCIDITFRVWETCDVNIQYRMSLLALAYKEFRTDSMFSQLKCQGYSCYAVSVVDYAMSWDGAQAKCKILNGNLVSVNSDAEWRYLTHNIIQQRQADIELIYMGYRTVSNPSHNDRILNFMNFFAITI